MTSSPKMTIVWNVHKSAARLHDAGYMDNVTMWEFDALCLPPPDRGQPPGVEEAREPGGLPAGPGLRVTQGKKE